MAKGKDMMKKETKGKPSMKDAKKGSKKGW